MKRWDAISRTRIVTHIYPFSAYMKPSSRESGYLRQMWEVENNTMKVKPRGDVEFVGNIFKVLFLTVVTFFLCGKHMERREGGKTL